MIKDELGWVGKNGWRPPKREKKQPINLYIIERFSSESNGWTVGDSWYVYAYTEKQARYCVSKQLYLNDKGIGIVEDYVEGFSD